MKWSNLLLYFYIRRLHIARGLYYGSYKSPRVLVWSVGVIIFIVMMATAFLGFIGPKWLCFYIVDVSSIQCACVLPPVLCSSHYGPAYSQRTSILDIIITRTWILAPWKGTSSSVLWAMLAGKHLMLSSTPWQKRRWQGYLSFGRVSILGQMRLGYSLMEGTRSTIK